MTTTWQLFVDESGDFGRPGDTVVVAGVLLRVDLQPRFRDALRDSLALVFPGVAYPPHATELNRYSDDRQRQQHEEALFQLGEALVSGLGPGGAFVVGAGESHTAAAIDALDVRSPAKAAERSAAEAGSRYRSLLATLLERVFALLREDGARKHQVYAHVLAPTFEGPTGKLFRYTQAMLIDDIRKAHELPHRTERALRGPASVTLSSFPPCAWDATIHPGLVLADFCANRLRQVLRRKPRWMGAQNHFSLQMGLALSAMAHGWPGREAPALAASGAPRQALQQAFLAGAPARPWLAHTSPAWAREQAMTWLSLLEGSR